MFARANLGPIIYRTFWISLFGMDALSENLLPPEMDYRGKPFVRTEQLEVQESLSQEFDIPPQSNERQVT